MVLTCFMECAPNGCNLQDFHGYLHTLTRLPCLILIVRVIVINRLGL